MLRTPFLSPNILAHMILLRIRHGIGINEYVMFRKTKSSHFKLQSKLCAGPLIQAQKKRNKTEALKKAGLFSLPRTNDYYLVIWQ